MSWFSKSRIVQDRVLVITTTENTVDERCWSSALSQQYKDFSFAVSVLPTKYFHGNQFLNRDANCAFNRESARLMALASNASHFLFIDSDIALPPDAIANLMLQRKDIIAGYYMAKGIDRKIGSNYACGRFTGWDGSRAVYDYFTSIPASVVRADVVGLGCCLISRRVLEKIPFRPGIAGRIITRTGIPIFACDSATFCADAKDAGFQPYMDASVVCEHLVRLP